MCLNMRQFVTYPVSELVDTDGVRLFALGVTRVVLCDELQVLVEDGVPGYLLFSRGVLLVCKYW